MQKQIIRYRLLFEQRPEIKQCELAITAPSLYPNK